MRAAVLLAEARKAGITLVGDGTALRLRAAASPDPALVARLRKAKAELIELLGREVEALLHPPGWQGWPDEQVAAVSLPDALMAPIDKCASCRFTGPLNLVGQCGPCVVEHPINAVRQHAGSRGTT